MHAEMASNARALLDSGELLLKHGKLHHAAHMGAICLEECAKYLMHIDPTKELFSSKSKRSHIAKGQLIGFFHYVAGGLSVVYAIRHATLMGYIGDSPLIKRRLLEELLKMCGISDRKSCAARLACYLEWKTADHDGDYGNDRIRKDTVYCDVINGVLLCPENRVTPDSISRTMSSARLAVGLVEMLDSGSFNWQRFESIFPDEFDSLQKLADDLDIHMGRVRIASQP